jgi:hypothetical protein
MSDVVDTRRFGSELARHNGLKYKDHSTSDFLLTDAASKWVDQVRRKPNHAALHRRTGCLYLDAASVI